MATRRAIFKAPRLLRCTSHASVCRHYSAPAERAIPLAKQKYVPSHGVYPKGFVVGSTFAGVKASNTKHNDLTLLVSEEPCAAAAVFTRNVFQAAPCQTSRATLLHRRSRGIRGVIVNSGCANAVTGKLGMEHANIMASEADKLFPTSLSNEIASEGDKDGTLQDKIPRTLVMSTGVIGQNLPIDRITSAIPKLRNEMGSSHRHWLQAAQAICTTDTFPKLLSHSFNLPSHPEITYTIAGMTKGAGMIAPNMATLLGIVCTDVKLDPDSIRNLMVARIQRSFNSISIDGDTSTNDTVALFANGAAAPPNTPSLTFPSSDQVDGSSSSPISPDAKTFQDVLETFLVDLAKLVVRDGEGATKFVTIRVRTNAGEQLARSVARSIATSALVKTALYGKDANWGRILCAIGYTPDVAPPMAEQDVALYINKLARTPADHDHSNMVVNPRHTSVSFVPTDGSEELKLLVRGEPEAVDELRAKEILEMEDLEILVRLSDSHDTKDDQTEHEAVFYTCDFSHEYVTINADYRT